MEGRRLGDCFALYAAFKMLSTPRHPAVLETFGNGDNENSGAGFAGPGIYLSKRSIKF